MKFQTALGACVIAISGSAAAAIDLQGNQTLILDTVLDGQLVSELQNIEYYFAGENTSCLNDKRGLSKLTIKSNAGRFQ